MLKRSTPIRFSHKKLSINTPKYIHKKLSINTPKDIHKKLSIDPQGFSSNVHSIRDPNFLFILSSSRSLNPFYLTHLAYFRVNHFP
jgi:hypothetical protein